MHAAPDPGDGPLPPRRRTLPEILARQRDRFGERPFATCAGTDWTHADAIAVAAARAALLAAAGIGRGDPVAILCGNRAEFLETFLGCGWLGAPIVPINTGSMTPQIAYFLADSRARLLVVEARYVSRLAGLDRSGLALASIWVVADGEAPAAPPPALPVALVPYPAGPVPTSSAPAGPPTEPPSPGDPIAILYTSGTTGPAKGVIVSHAQYYWWGVNTVSVLGIGTADVLCTTMPLFHINAFNTFVQAALAGCRVAYEPRFSASGFWPAMQARQATVVYLLGAMVPILLAQPASAAERAHRVRIGLGPGVPAAPMAAFLERTGVPLIEGYGSTETNFVIATRPDSPRRGVMGWLRPGFQARIADDDDVALPDGTPGELLLRAEAPHAFASGYFGLPEKTVEAWRNLWFHTGDRVVRDPDGAYRFVDRIKDAIRRRGENISSWEVEEALLSHPAVAAVAVFPVRSELAEDEVMAALIVRPGCVAEPAELVRHCESRLPYFAVPRYIALCDDLPRTGSGKIQKYLLRERGVTDTTWDRNRHGRTDGA